MTDFPTLVYKDKGPHQRPGGTYDYKAVNDADQFAAALADGWFATLAEVLNPIATVADDNAPATREELEAKATELGLKFDGRTGDKKLGAMIAEALKG
jgi:hypothetical protein